MPRSMAQVSTQTITKVCVSFGRDQTKIDVGYEYSGSLYSPIGPAQRRKALDVKMAKEALKQALRDLEEKEVEWGGFFQGLTSASDTLLVSHEKGE